MDDSSFDLTKQGNILQQPVPFDRSETIQQGKDIDTSLQ